MRRPSDSSCLILYPSHDFVATESQIPVDSAEMFQISRRNNNRGIDKRQRHSSKYDEEAAKLCASLD